MSNSAVLSVTAAAASLDVDNADLLDLVFRGEIACSQSASGRIQIPREALEEYVARRSLVLRSSGS